MNTAVLVDPRIVVPGLGEAARVAPIPGQGSGKPETSGTNRAGDRKRVRRPDAVRVTETRLSSIGKTSRPPVTSWS